MNRKIIGIASPSIPYLGEGEPVRVVAVLVEDDHMGRNLIAYRGIVQYREGEEIGSAAVLVMHRGSKLTFEEAKSLWPGVDARRYQR